MPKMKTKSGAKKRFKVTGTGKVVSKSAKMRHTQMNKPKSMKRKARKTFIMSDVDARIVLENFLPYLRGKVKRKKPANQNATSTKAATPAKAGE